MNKAQRTILVADLPERGKPLDGGILVDRYFIGNEQRALILLPNELHGAYGEYEQNIEGATSYSDGEKNTRAMAEAGSEIAKQALELAGHIPACLEAHLLMAAKTEGLIILREDRYCWLSTQHSAHDAYNVDFEDGWQIRSGKDGERFAPLVRSVLLQ